MSGIAGLLFVALSFIASGMNVEPPAYKSDPAAFAAWLRANGDRFRVGHFVAALAFLAFGAIGLAASTLLIARESLGWGNTAEVLTPENLQLARRMSEAWDESAAACRRSTA